MNNVFPKIVSLFSWFLLRRIDVNSIFFLLLCSPSVLLCAVWKILSFISLLLPATGAGWRIHARWTMQLRRFETKETIWRQHLASLNKEIASTKQRSGQLQEAQLGAGSGSVIGGDSMHRLETLFLIFLDFIYMYSSDLEPIRKTGATASLRCDNSHCKQGEEIVYFLWISACVCVCSLSADCSLSHT